MFLVQLENYMLPCLNKEIFGIDCPGCGIQRAIAFFLDGEFISAFKMFPAIYTIMLLIAFLGFSFFFEIKNSFKIKLYLLYLNAGIIIISYILKMLKVIY
ncbi:DUF2752 domain-containing protein [Arenibacter latericius]|uniref:DUF2752 domain-containing protein n=1 Tax=Arenibacter latericius TaxID=86104 RepID=UPI000412C135|nr:DUF2752 domain-containing protein [Arenibacter latericius]MDX1364665.1 DUF2752 domain-containing protein [Arenibacter latericius]